MTIKFSDKIKTLLKVYSCLSLLPFRYKIYILLKPLESTRYTEFAFLFNYLKFYEVKSFRKILDISSPFIMAYILSKKSKVIKTDINEKERNFIKESNHLKFQVEDVTNLSFSNEEFDFVFSISAIEHIYEKYPLAISEMIRVTKTGGLIYLSFPVSNTFREEWLDNDIYTHQKKSGGRTFFQYRFDDYEVNHILEGLSKVEILIKKIYWERKNGSYDRYIHKIRGKPTNFYLHFIKSSFLNLFYGFFLLKSEPGELNNTNSFGNISIVLKKVKDS